VKTLIFGKGWLGRRLHLELPDAVLTGVFIDVPSAVRYILAATAPTVVINAAGKNGRPNVDWCESHRLETARSNTLGPLVLAEECARIGARLIHLGSGCIFQGEGADESSVAQPSSYYTHTKAAADLVLKDLPNVAIVRLRMPFDGIPHERNFITKVAGFSRVINQRNSLTSVTDFVHVIRELIKRPTVSGVFHAVNPGAVTHWELLALYREIVDPTHAADFIELGELYSLGLAQAPRSNAVIQNTRLPTLGIHMRPVLDALRADLSEYAARSGAAPHSAT
jgi:3,5-epimerase/4-reductase